MAHKVVVVDPATHAELQRLSALKKSPMGAIVKVLLDADDLDGIPAEHFPQFAKRGRKPGATAKVEQ